MKIFLKIKVYLILVTIHRNLNFVDPVNKKVIGKMKDEFKGKNNWWIVRLKPKMYSLIAVDGGEIKKAKSSQ